MVESANGRCKAAFFCKSEDNIAYVYSLGRAEQLRETYDCLAPIISESNYKEHVHLLADVEVIFSTWGMWSFSEDLLDAMPKLRAVFYAAGSVKGFADPLLDRGITLMSAWAANAVPVAEYSLAQILLASKQYWQHIRHTKSRESFINGKVPRETLTGIFEQKVALIGAGMIGRKLIELLKPFTIHVSVVDPFLSEADATALGVSLVSLEQAFAEHNIVSNHLPNIPETVGLLTGAHFASMPQGATFINTGRGAQVVEAELQSVLAQRPDMVALLDVTFPEPAVEESPFYTADNVYLTQHIAGSIGNEVVRMADYALAECQKFLNGEALSYAVNKEMLKTMA